MYQDIYEEIKDIDPDKLPESKGGYYNYDNENGAVGSFNKGGINSGFVAEGTDDYPNGSEIIVGDYEEPVKRYENGPADANKIAERNWPYEEKTRGVDPDEIRKPPKDQALDQNKHGLGDKISPKKMDGGHYIDKDAMDRGGSDYQNHDINSKREHQLKPFEDQGPYSYTNESDGSPITTAMYLELSDTITSNTTQT